MKFISLCTDIILSLLLVTSACKKEHSSDKVAVPVFYDTLITLQNGGPGVRLSFATNTYIDIIFNSTIDEGRCPNCLTLGAAQCPYESWANANFEVKNQTGDSLMLQGSFKSCYAENDTTPGTNNQASTFGPFDTYNIWAIALNPYPTDTISSHYTLTLLVQYPFN